MRKLKSGIVIMYAIEFDLFAVFALFDNVSDNIMQHCVSECTYAVCGLIRTRACVSASGQLLLNTFRPRQKFSSAVEPIAVSIDQNDKAWRQRRFIYIPSIPICRSVRS